MGLISWLVTIGCLFIGAAIGLWSVTDANKIFLIWGLGFLGAIMLVVALGFELQKFANEPTPPAPQATTASVTQPVFQKRATIIVLYSNKAPEVTNLPFGKGLTISFYLRNIGDATAIVKGISAHVFLSEDEPDSGTQAGQALREDWIAGNNIEPLASTLLLGGQSQVVMDPGQTFVPPVPLVVGFNQSRIDAINGPGLHFKWLNDLWLRVIVNYDDPYKSGRQSSYWVRLSGTGTMQASPRYNYQR